MKVQLVLRVRVFSWAIPLMKAISVSDPMEIMATNEVTAIINCMLFPFAGRAVLVGATLL